MKLPDEVWTRMGLIFFLQPPRLGVEREKVAVKRMKE